MAEANGKLFQPGGPGGPGRPKGAKNRLGERYLCDLEEAWKEHGAEVIRSVIESDPATFLKVVASLVPKELLLNTAGGGGVTINVVTGVPGTGDAVEVIDQLERDRIDEPLSRPRPTATPVQRTAAEKEAMRRQREQRDT
jgi:hypothetical protein